MKLLGIVLFVAALVRLSSADFILYWVQQITFSQDTAITVDGFKILGPEFDGRDDLCERSSNLLLNELNSDVSGHKRGFRCKGSKNNAGCGLGGNSYDVEQLEWHLPANFNFHWTIYKDRRDNSQTPPRYHMYRADHVWEGANEYCVPLLSSNGYWFKCNYIHAHEEASGKWLCTSKYDWVTLAIGYHNHPPHGSTNGNIGDSNYIPGNSTSELAYLKANQGAVDTGANFTNGRRLNETELAEYMKDWTAEEADKVWAVYRGKA